MAQLALLGHRTRGKEIIKILEMLGGKNKYLCWGICADRMYLIHDSGNIEDIHSTYEQLPNYQVYTLEQFLEKYPYKVGDKVQSKGATSCGTVYVIEHMEWVNNHIEYEISPLYDYNHTGLVTVCAEDLQPYKEAPMYLNEKANKQAEEIAEILEPVKEIMEEKADTAKAINLIGEDYSGKRFVYKIPNGYEFDCLKNNEIILKPKQLEYPKTFKECCKVLNIPVNGDIVYAGNWVYGGEYLDKHLDKLRNFQKLFICRNAYWKIAEDWKEKRKEKAIHYVICSTLLGEVVKDTMPNCIANYLLDFPSAEMRDAFYENFKELIELCKELL